MAVLTSGGVPGAYENSNGMLYLVQDSIFVSGTQSALSTKSAKPELVQQRWKRLSKMEILNMAHHRTISQ